MAAAQSNIPRSKQRTSCEDAQCVNSLELEMTSVNSPLAWALSAAQ